MARIQLLPLYEMSPDERSACDEAELRGHAPAPMTAWLKNPEFARRAQKLGEFVRFQLSLPVSLRELAVLIVARYWAAHYEWQVHKKEALRHGLNARVVEAIAARRRPAFENCRERVVYDIATAILETRSVSESLFDEGGRQDVR